MAERNSQGGSFGLPGTQAIKRGNVRAYGFPRNIDYCLVTYVESVFNRSQLEQDEQYRINVIKYICEIVGGNYNDLTDDKEEEVKDRLIELVKKKRPDRGYFDCTMMKDDIKKFLLHFGYKYTETSQDKRIEEETSFGHLATNQDDIPVEHIEKFLSRLLPNSSLQVLYICGHGIGGDRANQLRENFVDGSKNECWQWHPLHTDADTTLRSASKGDVVAYHTGLISPLWVLEKLGIRENNCKNNNSYNTIIIILDSCHSGCWIDRIKDDLKKFEKTRVIIQTACGADEESYGEYFLPLWCDLQGKRNDIETIKQEKVLDLSIQTPSFFDSDEDTASSSTNLGGVFQVKINGYDFFFIDGKDFFLKFASYTHFNNFSNARRGIPKDEWNDFFKSFSTGKSTILSIKLKTHKLGTPQAFVLVEWPKNPTKEHPKHYYYLHLHFSGFNARRQKLTGINHVTAVQKLSHMECMYVEQNDKATLKVNDNNRGEYRDLVQKTKEFAIKNKLNWNDKPWNMTKAVPTNLIRSRTDMRIGTDLSSAI